MANIEADKAADNGFKEQIAGLREVLTLSENTGDPESFMKAWSELGDTMVAAMVKAKPE
jgi:hypothetical protein